MLRSSLLRSTLLRSALVLAVPMLVAGVASADVYKTKDAKGNVYYTDKPPTLPAERLNVQSQKTDVVAVQARQEAEAKRQEQSKGNQDGQAQQQNQPPAQLTAKNKADLCAQAQERYKKYNESQKLYEERPGSERRYLSAEEIDAARASAKASMDALCK
jgi:hypothetical protein